MPRTGNPRLVATEMMSRRDPRLSPPLVTAVGAIVALAAERARSADEFAALREAIRVALENAAVGVAAEGGSPPARLLDLDAAPPDLATLLGRAARGHGAG